MSWVLGAASDQGSVGQSGRPALSGVWEPFTESFGKKKADQTTASPE